MSSRRFDPSAPNLPVLLQASSATLITPRRVGVSCSGQICIQPPYENIPDGLGMRFDTNVGSVIYPKRIIQSDMSIFTLETDEDVSDSHTLYIDAWVPMLRGVTGEWIGPATLSLAGGMGGAALAPKGESPPDSSQTVGESPSAQSGGANKRTAPK
jgi:hypothetical protein